jgi:hypothetical protein
LTKPGHQQPKKNAYIPYHIATNSTIFSSYTTSKKSPNPSKICSTFWVLVLYVLIGNYSENELYAMVTEEYSDSANPKIPPVDMNCTSKLQRILI